MTTDDTKSVSRRALRWSVVTALISMGSASWLLSRYEREVSGGERVAILRARQPIERGSALSDDMLIEASVPASYVEARSVLATDRAKLRGVRIANGLATQDAVLWSDLAVSSEHRDLSALVQPGSRAVTIRAALGGDIDTGMNGQLVRPGDYVDVLATLTPPNESYSERSPHLFSVLLLQRALVLAVGAVTDPQALRDEAAAQALSNSRDSTWLTLSLKTEEAQLLSLAQERGKLSVALRMPDDSKVVESAPELSVSNLFDTAFRNELQRKRSEGRPVRLVATAVPK